MALYCKVDCMLDSHPKIRKAGRLGREVFLFILRRHRALDGKGFMSIENVDPDYLADQLMMTCNEAVTGVTACVTAKLIAVTASDVQVIGWDDDWSREPASPAERVAKHRKNKRLADDVTKCNVTDVNSNECNVREEKRREEKKRVLFASAPGEAEPAEPKAKKAIKRALPDDWAPNAKHAAKAKELGLQLGKATEDFRNYWGARGDAMKNWDLAFNTWLGNAVKFAARSNGGRAPEQPRHMPVVIDTTGAPDPQPWKDWL